MHERPAEIAIQIDVLEVDGLSRADAPGFQRDVERELARRLQVDGFPAGSLRSRSLLSVEAGAGTEPLAFRVAAAIYQALGQ
jgi:hypothetical protein